MDDTSPDPVETTVVGTDEASGDVDAEAGDDHVGGPEDVTCPDDTAGARDSLLEGAIETPGADGEDTDELICGAPGPPGPPPQDA